MAVGKRTCGAKASGTTTRRRTKTPAKPAKPAKAKKKPLHSPPSKNSIVAKRKSVGNTAKSPVVRLTPGVDHVKENAPLHSHYKYIRRGYRAGLNVKETIWSAFQRTQLRSAGRRPLHLRRRARAVLTRVPGS